MRITHVEAHRVFQPAASPPFSWRRGLLGGPPDAEIAVLRIGTDAGVEGVAMLPRPGAGAVVSDLVERVLRDQLVGQDPLQRELHWHRIWELDRIEELPLPVLGLVDIALWDLAGRHTGQPTWQVLGGYRDKIGAYASTATFATTPSPWAYDTHASMAQTGASSGSGTRRAISRSTGSKRSRESASRAFTST